MIPASAQPVRPRERIRADLVLLVAAVLWGSSFVPGRVAAGQLGSLTYNGARFLLGALVLFPLAYRRLAELQRLEIWGGLLAGVLLCCGANLQQSGMVHTTAGKAGFITGLYVVLVPLLIPLARKIAPSGGLYSRQGWALWIAILMAFAGLFLLSGSGKLVLSPGDGLEIAGAVFWALHVIAVGVIASRGNALGLAVVQNATCGLISILPGLALETNTAHAWQEVWWAVAYNGIVSAGIAFTLQLAAQRRAPPADAAIVMSLEAVFAAAFGRMLLGETLTRSQLVGCALILAAVLLVQARNVTGDGGGRRGHTRQHQC